jgi:hypothetical protein
MTNGEWKKQVREFKRTVGADPTIDGYDGDADFNITLGLDGRGPMADHPEVKRLAALYETVIFTGDYVGVSEMKDGAA